MDKWINALECTRAQVHEQTGGGEEGEKEEEAAHRCDQKLFLQRWFLSDLNFNLSKKP